MPNTQRSLRETGRTTVWVRTLLRSAQRARRLLVSQQARDNARYERHRTREGPPDIPSGKIRHVLFVCQGNICRSPFAEHLFGSRRGDLQVRSAGLEAGEGSPADTTALTVAERFSVSLASHAAHRLDGTDLAWADLVLGMEGHHVATIARRWPHVVSKTRVLGGFLPDGPYSLSDPYGRGEDAFTKGFDRIALALENLPL